MEQVTIDLDIFMRLLHLATTTKARTTSADIRAFMMAGKAISDIGMTYEELCAKLAELNQEKEIFTCSSSE